MEKMNKVCCICSQSTIGIARDLLALVHKHTGVSVHLLSPGDSVADYEVVLYVLSKDSMKDEAVTAQLVEASHLNKTFIPVIPGGNWFSSWLMERRYKGPDLRSPILHLRKDDQMHAFMQQLASYSGTNISGDFYGAEIEISVDLECRILRDGNIIAESGHTGGLSIFLYKGTHKLTLRSTKYPELSEEIKIKVRKIPSSQKINVKLARHRIVSKRPFDSGYYEGSLYLDTRDGEGTFWYPDGAVYTGSWKDDMPSGKGKKTYCDGSSYNGHWEQGVQHGMGTEYDTQGKKVFEGEWSWGEYSKGTRYYADGGKYDGEWENGIRQGFGTEYFPNGKKMYEGEWADGERHGHGIEYNSKGKIEFEGEWINGEKQTFFKKIKTWREKSVTVFTRHEDTQDKQNGIAGRSAEGVRRFRHDGDRSLPRHYERHDFDENRQGHEERVFRCGDGGQHGQCHGGRIGETPECRA